MEFYKSKPLCCGRFGFSLTEVTVSLGIAAFCLVTLFGLLPVGLSANRSAVEQTLAGGVATAVVADLRAASVTAKASPSLEVTLPVFGDPLSVTHTTFFVRDDGSPVGENGNVDLVYNDNVSKSMPRYRVTVDMNWAPKSESVLWSRVRVSWPPMISLAENTTVKPAGIVEVMTSLNRRP